MRKLALLPEAAIMGATAASVLGHEAAKGIVSKLRSVGDEHLKTLPTSTRDKTISNKVRSKYGLNVGYTYAPRISRGNAAYVKPSGVTKYLDENPNMPGIVKKRLKATNTDGLVLVGKGWKKPGVLEHEFGHAVAGERGNAIEKAVHKPWVDKYSLLYHKVPAAVLSVIAGRKYGLGAGLATGGISGLGLGAPALYRELSADKYGRKLMTEKDKSRDKRWPFIGSYIANAAAPAMVGGGVAGAATTIAKILARRR